MPGLEGLTLLEAAAVPGETLATDALANALGPIFRAEPQPGRTAVAMSGGVDSAVALLRALPNAIGVTLRLWLDPAGPNAERACCSPEAVIAARETCHRLGIPHVTLDLREEFRRAIVSPFLDGYANGETPNPVHPLQRRVQVRRAARIHRARGLRSPCDRPLRTRRRASRAHVCSRAPPTPRRIRATCWLPVDPRHSARVWFPLGAQGKDETRAEAQRAGLEVAQRAESQEACFLAGDDYRAFLTRHGVAPRAGEIVDEEGNALGEHQGTWAYTPGQRRGIGVVAERPLYVLDTNAASNTVVVGPHEALARRRVRRRAGSTFRSTGPTRSSAIARPPSRPRCLTPERASSWCWTSPSTAWPAARRLFSTKATRSSAAEPSQRPPEGRIGPECSSPHSRGGISGDSPSPFSCSPSASLRPTSSCAWAEPPDASPRSSRGAEQEILPVINKVGGSVDRVNGQLDKVDRMTDSAVDAVESVDTAVRTVSNAVTRPVQKVSGFAAGVSYGAADFKAKKDWKHAVQAGKEAAVRREQELTEELEDTVSDEIRLGRPCPGGLPADRASRRRRARRPSRPDDGRARRPSGRARRVARAA